MICFEICREKEKKTCGQLAHGDISNSLQVFEENEVGMIRKFTKWSVTFVWCPNLMTPRTTAHVSRNLEVTRNLMWYKCPS